MPSFHRREVLTMVATASVLGSAGCSSNNSRDYTYTDGHADWPTIGRDSSHTGNNPSGTGPNNSPRIKWQVELTMATGAPIVAGESVLFTDNKRLHCYNLDGVPKWTYTSPNGNSFWTTPTIVNQAVYLPSMENYVQILNLGDGGEVGKLRTNGPVISPPSFEHDDRFLYVSTKNGWIHAYDQETGKEQWRHQITGPILSPVTVRSPYVYAHTPRGSIYAVSTKSGEQKWQNGFSAPIKAASTALESHLFIPCYNGPIYALEPDTGDLLWKSKQGGFVDRTLATTAGTVFGTDSRTVVALDSETGQKKWGFKTDGQIGRALAIADDTLYVGSFGGKVYGLKTDGGIAVGPLHIGGKKWEYDFNTKPGEGIAVADGDLFVVSEAIGDTPPFLHVLTSE